MMGRTHFISALVTFTIILQLCFHPCNSFSPTKDFFLKHKWENVTNSLTSGATKGFFNDQELTTYLKDLHKNFPDLVPKLETIGKTIEKKDIYSLVLTSSAASNSPQVQSKPKVLFTGFLHGTDFLSTAALLNFANYLIYGYLHKHPDATYLLQNREIWIVPAINLDSYAYVSDYIKTHNRTYLITKNRNQNDPTDICGDSAIGVNLNRNFDVNFDSLDIISGVQTSYDPKSVEYICRPYYRGEKPFSEPETAAIRDLLNKQNFELGINLMGIGPKFILPQTFAENLNTRLFYESIQAECPFPADTAFGTRFVISKEVANGEMTDYMFQKKNIISASFMIGISGKEYGGYFPTIPKIKKLLSENLDSLLYFIYKSGENLRIQEVWQSSCYRDNLTQCSESKDARYYFQLKISNSGLRDFSQNPSLLLRFSNEEVYSIEQIFLTTSDKERKQIDFTTVTQNGQLFYKVEGPSLKKGESFIITPFIVRTSSASFGRYSEIPGDEPQYLLAQIEGYPNTHISHIKTLIKHPNFDIDEMVAKKLATRRLIVTSGICVMSSLLIGLGGWVIVKCFKKQPKSHQFTKLENTPSRDIEGQIEMTNQKRKNKHKEEFDEGRDRPKRKSKRRSESGSGSGSSQSRERSSDKPKSKTKQPKELKGREGSKDKKSKKKYSQLKNQDDDDLRDIKIHQKKAN